MLGAAVALVCPSCIECGLKIVATFWWEAICRLRRMRGMLTIVTDARVVCQSVCLSVMRLKSAAAECAVYAVCRVCGVIWFSLCLITSPLVVVFLRFSLPDHSLKARRLGSAVCTANCSQLLAVTSAGHSCVYCICLVVWKFELLAETMSRMLGNLT